MNTHRSAVCRALCAFTIATIIPPASAVAAETVFDAAAFTGKPLEVAKSYTTDVNLKSYKGTKKVMIGMAAITFKLESNAFAKATDVLGGMRTGTASSAMSMTLGGVSKEALQQIADGFHEQLEAEFKALGVEIIESAAARASPKFAKYAENNNNEAFRQPRVDKNVGGIKATVITLTGHGMPLIGTGIAGIGAAARPMIDWSLALGENVTVIYTHVLVDFASMSGSGGLLAKSSSVSGKPQLNIQAVYSCGFFRGYNGGAMGVTKQIISDADFGAEVKEASNVTNTDWFSGSTAGKATYVVMADEAKFKTGVGGMLKVLAQMFTARLKDRAN